MKNIEILMPASNKNGIAIANTLNYGFEGAYEKDILKEAKAYIEKEGIREMLLKNLWGVDFVVSSGDSLDDLVAKYKFQRGQKTQKTTSTDRTKLNNGLVIESYDNASDTIIAHGQPGFNIKTDILPVALKLLDSGYSNMIIRGLNGVTLLIYKGMTLEQCEQKLKEQQQFSLKLAIDKAKAEQEGAQPNA